MASRLKSFLYNEEAATKRLKLASVALECDREPETNRAKMGQMTGAIMGAHPDVELVLFGETILGWYDAEMMRDYHRRTAEPVPGETTTAMAALAVGHGVYVSFGLSESADGKLYNTQVLINPAGEIQAVHRKRCPKSDLYSRGDVPVTITDIKGIRTGMIICADAASPRTMWELMRSRLDLILLSLADDGDPGWFAAQFNARMYDAWLVTANRYGDQNGYFWDGHLVISDPLGRLRVAVKDREQYVVYELAVGERGSWARTATRNVVVKAPLISLVLRNWRQVRSYL
jgi:predicted amidohydrolase